jgi:hypothetical protein
MHVDHRRPHDDGGWWSVENFDEPKLDHATTTTTHLYYYYYYYYY